jgi:hypothetical protein
MNNVELAARNNALWCDTVCRAHGAPGEFLPTVWLNRSALPPYHPNLVVLSDSSQSATIAHIRDLMELPLPARWSVKDSFFNLSLAAEGFEVLFQASWIWGEPTLRDSRSVSAGIRWSHVSSSTELARWEAAWSGDGRNPDATGRPAQFPPALLANPQVAFFAGYQDQEIVAGGIANRTEGVVGLSNVFVSFGDASAVWAGLVNSTQEAFPDLPFVGYERDAALEAALACGFEPIGKLRVWMHCDGAGAREARAGIVSPREGR